MATFLFDLDMTLVDSSALNAWRSAGLWGPIKANMHLVRPFATGSIQPHQLPQRMRDEGQAIGIVTSSPRWYAESILKDFEVPYDVLVAYHDTEAHKPSPEPIKLALERLDVPPDTAVYLGDDPIDVEAAYHAGVFSAGAAWGVRDFVAMSSAAPDAFFRRPRSVLAEGDMSGRRYAGEVLANGSDLRPHWGSVLRWGAKRKRYAVGRYFKTADPRHGNHEFSAQLLALKTVDTPARALAQSLAAALERIDWTPDFIVPIPPKPSQTRNRFREVLQLAKRRLPGDAEVLDDGLICTKEIDGYKGMSPAQRAAAIRGAFSTEYDWDGDRVLLLDDVFTTGETLDEATRVLLQRGARDVRSIALGRTQNTFLHKLCSACGRSMRVRSGKYGMFWGCSGYPDHCQNTEHL